MNRRKFFGQLAGLGAALTVTKMASEMPEQESTEAALSALLPQVCGLWIADSTIQAGDIVRHMDGRPIAMALQDGEKGQLIRVQLLGDAARDSARRSV